MGFLMYIKDDLKIRVLLRSLWGFIWRFSDHFEERSYQFFWGYLSVEYKEKIKRCFYGLLFL